MTMPRWRAKDDPIEHRIIAIGPSCHRYRTITLSPLYHHVIALSFYRAIAPSSSHCRSITSSSSRSRTNCHCTIAPLHYRLKHRWYDHAIVNYMALSGYHRIGPCSWILHHHTIDIWVDSAMVRYCDDDDAIMRWCDVTIAWWRWCDGAISDSAMTR